MKNLSRDSIDFGTMKVSKLFRTMLVPTLLGMIFNAVFVLTDGIFIGHGVGADGIASVNLVAPIMMIVTGIGMMLGLGGSVVAAIHLSQDNVKAARINVTQAFWSCVAVAVVLGLVFYIFPSSVLRVLGVSDALMVPTREYYLWFIPTCLFLSFQIVGEYIIRLDGSPRYAMYANIIPAVINIILDYVFIFPCNMGLRGAALATDLGTFVGFAMTFYYVIFRAERLRYYRLKTTATSLVLTCRNVGYMMRMGFTGLLGEFAISVMVIAGNRAFGHYLGDDGIAAYSVICYIFPLVYMIYSAVAQSAQPIISYNYGAGFTTRSREALRYSVGVGVVFGLFVTLLFCLLPNTVVGVFITPMESAFALTTEGLPLYALAFTFLAFNVSVINYLQSVERPMVASVMMILRGMALPVLAFVLLPHFMAVPYALWLAIPLSEFLTSLAIAVYIVVYNQRHRLHKVSE